MDTPGGIRAVDLGGKIYFDEDCFEDNLGLS